MVQMLKEIGFAAVVALGLVVGVGLLAYGVVGTWETARAVPAEETVFKNPWLPVVILPNGGSGIVFLEGPYNGTGVVARRFVVDWSQELQDLYAASLREVADATCLKQGAVVGEIHGSFHSVPNDGMIYASFECVPAQVS